MNFPALKWLSRLSGVVPGMAAGVLSCLVLVALVSAPIQAQPFFPCANHLFDNGFESPPSPEPLCDDGISQHHRLPAPEGITLWTAGAIEPVGLTDPAPVNAREGVMLSAARGEYEAVQIALRSDDSRDTASVQITGLDGLGGPGAVSISQVGFDGENRPTALVPRQPGEAVNLDPVSATVFWIRLQVPPGAPAGVHEGALTVELQSAGQLVFPLQLYVYGFGLPAAPSLNAIVNVSFSSPADDLKQELFDARLAPGNPTWPSGFAPGVTWDQTTHLANRCTTFDDESDHEPNLAFQLAALADRYMHGAGWNGLGFPESMLFTPTSSADPRPANFCDESIGVDRFGTAAYNEAWQTYLDALEEYLGNNDYLDRGFALLQYQPQSAEDDELAAHLCTLARAAAPSLRIGIAEQPKPEIAELADSPCGYDVWLAPLTDLDRDYALQRQAGEAEALWLDAGFAPPLPFLDPGNASRSGRSTRFAPWLAWVLRARGWHFPVGDELQEPGKQNLSLQAELLREGLEDFEYLRLANGGQPQAGVPIPVDVTARSVVSSPLAMAGDAQGFARLRHQLGRKIEGRRQSFPTYLAPVRAPRASYYLNFQDPAGEPSADPLEVDGTIWQKVGWELFDRATGRGWIGDNLGVTGLSGFDPNSGFDVVQRSYVFNDYGQVAVFEFGLEPGLYVVRVGVGRPSQSNPDPQHVDVEGVLLVDDELLGGQVERIAEVEVVDGSLTLTMGGLHDRLGAARYTFLAYLSIEPAGE